LSLVACEAIRKKTTNKNTLETKKMYLCHPFYNRDIQKNPSRRAELISLSLSYQGIACQIRIDVHGHNDEV